MAVLLYFLFAYAFLSLLYWLWMLYGAIRVTRSVRLLADLNPPEPTDWPCLAVIVPARNEADKLESAARTLLAENYPNLRIVLVDDRSTDCTGQIIDRLAAQDQRVKAVHISELPDGWMGKVNALNTGLAESTSQFVLFTDADVHFKQGTLRKAVAYCLQRNLDHLAALPECWQVAVVLDSMISVFLRIFLLFMSRPWAAQRSTSRAYLGVGAFNMVRRSAFEATEGFQWLRREVADDMGLGLLMKRSGAKCASLAAFSNVGLHWYRSISEISRGVEKGYATLSDFSFARTMAISLLVVAMEISPIVLLVFLFFDKLRLVGYGGIVVFAGFVLSVITVSRWAQARIWVNLLSPLTAWLLAGLFIRAGLVARQHGGVNWRGTLYRAEKFRHEQRVRFP